MSIEKASPLDVSRAKTIVLAGQEFTVVPLPLRQIMEIGDMLPKFNTIRPRVVNGEASMSELLNICVDIVVCGLKKAYPAITRDDLLDLSITAEDLMAAVPVIAQQGRGEAVPAGETKAASPSTEPSGTDSSQSS